MAPPRGRAHIAGGTDLGGLTLKDPHTKYWNGELHRAVVIIPFEGNIDIQRDHPYREDLRRRDFS